MRTGLGSDGSIHVLQLLGDGQSICGAVATPSDDQAADVERVLASANLCLECRGFIDMVEIGDEELWLHLVEN